MNPILIGDPVAVGCVPVAALPELELVGVAAAVVDVLFDVELPQPALRRAVTPIIARAIPPALPGVGLGLGLSHGR